MIVCPKCGGETRVLETRSTELGSVRRRRACLSIACNGRVTTVEVVAPTPVTKAQTTALVAMPKSAINGLERLLEAAGRGRR